ncbi:hypothetical protein RB195_014680 [Necator americanus]|uniref:Uncharacterized protein n=1 Tax=Necator americanus TaxID=51031 RepID=A0ABR1E174_NECAM
MCQKREEWYEVSEKLLKLVVKSKEVVKATGDFTEGRLVHVNPIDLAENSSKGSRREVAKPAEEGGKYADIV